MSGGEGSQQEGALCGFLSWITWAGVSSPSTMPRRRSQGHTEASQSKLVEHGPGGRGKTRQMGGRITPEPERDRLQRGTECQL